MNAEGLVRIRAAGVSDAADIARIHMASRAATMPYLPPQKRNHEQVTRWVEEVILKESHTWVAVRGAELLGYAALKGDLLEHLYLRPDVLRRGVGTLLLDEVKRNCPGRLILHVFELNTGARQFYAHHGFTVLERTDGSRNMEHLPDQTLEWVSVATR
ncbi:GNAT family N-acetyltransferase [Streptomyces sp. NPDC046727]|uniref:GNAT family N-acetyltransferase n=1 Tax=Streptomyces sp. NPDC046727 TaxID=3155373 RepID=UPI0033FB5FF0